MFDFHSIHVLKFGFKCKARVLPLTYNLCVVNTKTLATFCYNRANQKFVEIQELFLIDWVCLSMESELLEPELKVVIQPIYLSFLLNAPKFYRVGTLIVLLFLW